MTYATLEAPVVSSTSNSDYISQGSDEAEAKHWAAVVGHPMEDDEQDYTGDLEAMGLR
jgi:hypothetical protein